MGLLSQILPRTKLYTMIKLALFALFCLQAALAAPNSGQPGMKVTDLNPWRRNNVEFVVKEKGFQCPPEALKVENSEYTRLTSGAFKHAFDVVCPGGAVERCHAALYLGHEVMEWNC